jgi:hypothetical protein
VVLAVDDDGDVLEALRQALGKRYGADYQILTERSPAEGLGVLERLRSQMCRSRWSSPTSGCRS